MYDTLTEGYLPLPDDDSPPNILNFCLLNCSPLGAGLTRILAIVQTSSKSHSRARADGDIYHIHHSARILEMCNQETYLDKTDGSRDVSLCVCEEHLCGQIQILLTTTQRVQP